MAHYAFLDTNNRVTEVITGRDRDEIVNGVSDWEKHYGEFRNQVCKETSYNGNYRKNYACIGHFYDEQRNAFIAPQPFRKWILNESTCQWEAPTPYPSDGLAYVWNDNKGVWESVEKMDTALTPEDYTVQPEPEPTFADLTKRDEPPIVDP